METNITTLPYVNSQEKNISVIDDEGSPLLNDKLFGSMLRLAEIMCKSNTLPVHLRNNPGDCLRVIEHAYRVKQSPFALADGCFCIGGKLGWEGKTIAAMINSHPKIEGSLNYSYRGDKSKPEEFICTVTGKLRFENEPRAIEISLKQGLDDSKGARERWQKDPMQMLAYYGSRVWARRHAPEVIGGLYSYDELMSVPSNQAERDVTPISVKEEIDTLAKENLKKLINQINNCESVSVLEGLRDNDLKKFKGAEADKNKLREAYKSRMNILKSEAELTEAMETNNVDEPVSSE